MAALADAIMSAAAAGDAKLAKVAHEALGKLLPQTGAGAVADLDVERAKRRRE